jgi:hypothetical protein
MGEHLRNVRTRFTGRVGTARAEHVGSLLRPAALLEAREAHAGGLAAEELRKLRLVCEVAERVWG